MIYSLNQLLNGVSKLMNVNGSVTPRVFTYTAESDQLLTSLLCLLKDEGSTAFGNFGTLAALTNGVLIQIVQSGVTKTLGTAKDNADICMIFPKNQFGNGAVLSILSIVSPEGFGDTNNCFVGSLNFSKPITLLSGDSVTVTIQDNLTNVDVFQMSCGVYKD